MTYNSHPFQLLEINVISAQDLAPVSKSVKTYAVVWVHPERKLTTKVDQTGHTNPQWNEKFVFRVEDSFLESETSTIMIEIYAAAWLRDVQIGSVRVLMSNLFPSTSNSSKMRFVALQVRRPSGRPQGILNLGVQLLNSAMRSMPLYTELSASGVGFNELIDAKTNAKNLDEKMGLLRRTRSDRTDLTSSESQNTKQRYGGVGGVGSVVTGSSMLSSSLVNSNININNIRGGEADHQIGSGANGNGSMVNGSQVSDVGPSASIVAAAIAKGLIKRPGTVTPPANSDPTGSSIIDDWSESDTAEGLRTKLERWRAELPPVYDSDVRKAHSKSKHHSKKTAKRKEGRKLFSCMGNAFGLEISISCGGRGKKKYANRKVCHLSSVDGESYV
ncbi:hypothetical protein Tsubulata_042930 [Turnera subulata]|uniref:C2 domain-containing protein n=1 Tax=Turnera subulata TaxID=218843 RepID=A0A9Q0F0C4_9ROSI|nr:hypothetical protein Tsubulata_042930 [Turnera subulata]